MNNFNRNKYKPSSDAGFKVAAVGFILVWAFGILSSFAITGLIIAVLYKILTKM